MIGLKGIVYAMTSPYVVSVWLILLFFPFPPKMSWVKLIRTNLKVYGRQLVVCSRLIWWHVMDFLCRESVLNNLFSSQLFDLIRTCYVFRKKAAENLYDCKYSAYFGACQCPRFNRNIRSKSKQYLKIGMIKVSFISVICLSPSPRV